MKKAILSLMLTAAALLTMAACSSKSSESAPASTAKTFVLVHGAWQAPFVWQNVKSQLEAKGQKVIVVELPGHGSDHTSPATLTIDGYRDKVIDALNGVQGKVVLVGHSMGGVVISEVAEKIPGKIEKLVYLGAFVPASGQSLIDLASQDKQSQLGPSLVPSQDQFTLDVKHDNIVSIFCQDAPATAQQQVLDNYRAEPAIPFSNKVTLTDANFGSVDKYYIHTTLDHAIGMDLQNQMVAAAHITKTYSVNAGHSAFLSKPDDVTNILMTIAAR